MKDCDLLITNGDSYSATVAKHPVYADHVAKSYGMTLDNVAKSGSNNDRILRSTTEAVIHHLEKDRRPFVIVGLSFVRRQEIWLTDMEMIYKEHALEKYPASQDPSQILPVVTLDWVLNRPEYKERFKHLVVEDFYVHKKLLDFYFNLYLFQQFLMSREVPYFIFSAAKNTDCPVHCFPAIQHLSSVKSVVSDPAIFELHEHCVMHWAQINDPEHNKVTGHLSATGHESYADWLIIQMEKIYGT